MNFKRFLGIFFILQGLCAVQPALADTNAAAPAIKVVSHTYGSWVYQCAVPSSAGDVKNTSCRVIQTLGIMRDGQVIPTAALIFQKSPDNQGYLLSALVPLGFLIPPGVAFFGDNMPAVIKNVTLCDPHSCVIAPQPAAGLVEELKIAQMGHLRFAKLDGQAFTINFKLNGFSDAIKALDRGIPPSA